MVVSHLWAKLLGGDIMTAEIGTPEQAPRRRFDELIANGIPEGPTVVTIAESDVAFESNGCADWVRR